MLETYIAIVVNEKEIFTIAKASSLILIGSMSKVNPS